MLVEALKAQDHQRRVLERRLATLDQPIVSFDRTMERRLRAAVAEWRVALSRQVAQARQIVTKLIDGRWTVTPEEKDGVRGFRLVAMGSFAKLIAVTVPALSTLQTLASLSTPSWNQIASFIESMRQLRDSSGSRRD